jgi:hypothetical protein
MRVPGYLLMQTSVRRASLCQVSQARLCRKFGGTVLVLIRTKLLQPTPTLLPTAALPITNCT